MQSEISTATASAHESFLHVRVSAGSIVVAGVPEALLGHRLEHTDGADDPGGNWVEWRWDGQQLTVTNDRNGSFPLYYAGDGNGIIISASIDRLLERGADRTLDDDAVSAFLGVGYYLDDDTPFRAIRRLPPAGMLTWAPGRLAISGGYRRFGSREMTRAAAIDGLIETVRAAVARNIPVDSSDYVMPISGGRDSRHLLLELIRQGHPPRDCVTTPQYASLWGGKDPRFAARLCDVLGLPHRTLDLPGPMLAAEWRKNELTGYCSSEHTWSLSVADAVSGESSHTYDGLPGGLLLQRQWERSSKGKRLLAGRADEVAESLVRSEDGRPRWEGLVSEAARPRFSAERAAARIRSSLEWHLASPDPMVSWQFWNRAVRELSLVPNAIYSDAVTAYTPYMDREFIDFATSLPAHMTGKSLHEAAIARAFPQVADVPFAPLGSPDPGRGSIRSLDRDLFRLLLTKSDGSLVDRVGLSRRVARGAVTADDWITRGRRATLATYLIQLESLGAR